MASSIVTNRLTLPFSYKTGVLSGPLVKYLPFNGGGNSPGTIRLGGTQSFTIGSVPADLSTFILNAPNGQSYTFQFVYNASVQTLGIKIPLPLSGASTAAQVRAAIMGIMSLSGAFDINGVFRSFPWVALSLLTTSFEIDWRVAGALVPVSGTQATISVNTAVAQSIARTNNVVPARFGKNYAWMSAIS